MTGKVLIVYFTHSWNTEKIAKIIAEKTGGDLFRLEPETAYPCLYGKVTKQAKKEIEAGFMPVLKKADMIPEVCQTIFIGTPNWWGTMAPPVKTFLTEADLAGKTVIPFCTHGGGGEQKVIKDIAALCGGASVKTAFSVYGAGDADVRCRIDRWIKEADS